jgi:hypothetical protein
MNWRSIGYLAAALLLLTGVAFYELIRLLLVI